MNDDNPVKGRARFVTKVVLRFVTDHELCLVAPPDGRLDIVCDVQARRCPVMNLWSDAPRLVDYAVGDGGDHRISWYPEKSGHMQLRNHAHTGTPLRFADGNLFNRSAFGNPAGDDGDDPVTARFDPRSPPPD